MDGKVNGRDGIGMTSGRTRLRMIENLRREGVTDERVLNAMAEIPRHAFVDEGIASRAYEDVALPIGHGQTISSPAIVGLMTQMLLAVQPMSKVLEVGTGCGYQTAVLARLAKEVYTLERIAPLMDKARRHLRDLRFYNIRYKHADGHAGYAEGAPYDGILMAASATHVPEALKMQLAVGGRMVLPVGTDDQWLYVVDRKENGFVEQKCTAVRFVPLLPGLA
ncbi:MAG: protein-L-isoaspartate(D-aspartate) O-methyltransferase [Usitatibacter sp.]